MTIVREGIEYELTPEEMRKAFNEMKGSYYKEDLISRIIEKVIDEEDIDNYDNWCGELPKEENPTEKSKVLRELFEDVDFLADALHRALDYNDSFWDSYWRTADYVIDEAVKTEMGKE